METLLIVDDDLSLLESLKMHFEEVEDVEAPKYQVVTAASAAAALQTAAESSPSLVILDMMLPDRSGLQIIEEMKALCGDAPILIVTAHHDMETTIRAMKAGAFDYIHKPFTDPAALDLVVARALQVPAVQARSGHQFRRGRDEAGRHRWHQPRDAAAHQGDRQGSGLPGD